MNERATIESGLDAFSGLKSNLAFAERKGLGPHEAQKDSISKAQRRGHSHSDTSKPKTEHHRVQGGMQETVALQRQLGALMHELLGWAGVQRP